MWSMWLICCSCMLNHVVHACLCSTRIVCSSHPLWYDAPMSSNVPMSRPPSPNCQTLSGSCAQAVCLHLSLHRAILQQFICLPVWLVSGSRCLKSLCLPLQQLGCLQLSLSLAGARLSSRFLLLFKRQREAHEGEQVKKVIRRAKHS